MKKERCNSSEKTTGETQLPIMRWKASDAETEMNQYEQSSSDAQGGEQSNIMFSGQLIRRRGDP